MSDYPADKPRHDMKRQGVGEQNTTKHHHSDVTAKAFLQLTSLLKDKTPFLQSVIKDPESRAAPAGMHGLGGVLDRIRQDFAGVESVTGIHYALEGCTLHLIVLHDQNDEIGILKEIHRTFQPIEKAFPDLYFQDLLLHRDEVAPGQLSGTSPVFVRQ